VATASIFFDLIGRDKASKDFNKVGKSADSLGSKLGSLTRKGAKWAAGIAVAGATIGVAFGVSAVKSAADLEQSIGAVDAVFKTSADQMHKWARSAADDVGLARKEYNELATVLGSQLKNGGTSLEELGGKTNELISLGADLSSMFGGTTREAVEALSSALKGEYNPIEKYGATLKKAEINAEAARLGFKKLEGGFSNQAEQAATLSLIMDRTKDAHGNFGRETGTLSNKIQRLGARWDDLKAKIGTALLPVVTQLFGYIESTAMPQLERFGDWFEKDGGPAISDFAEKLKPLGESLLPAVGTTLGIIRDALVAAAPLAKEMVDAFNSMPDWAKTVLVGGAGAGFLAYKLKSLIPSTPGGGGLPGTIASKATPVPVFVTNPGFGTGTPGGNPGKHKRVKATPLLGTPALAITGAVLSLGGDSVQEKRKISEFERYNAPSAQDALRTVAAGLNVDIGSGFLGLGRDLGKLDKALKDIALEDPIRALDAMRVAAENAEVPFSDISKELPVTTAALELLLGGANRLAAAADGASSKVSSLAGSMSLIPSGSALAGLVAAAKIAAGAGTNAAGTGYWRGGRTWVGEQGPELLDLPRGSRIYRNGVQPPPEAGSGGLTAWDLEQAFYKAATRANSAAPVVRQPRTAQRLATFSLIGAA
jgi:hypothetical protein